MDHETTLEIPDAIFHRAKARVAEQRVPLREFISEAVAEKLGAKSPHRGKARMKLAGGLRHLRKEAARITQLMERYNVVLKERNMLDKVVRSPHANQIEPNANLEPPKENPESEAKHSGSDTFEGLDLVPDPYIGRNKSWFYARDERGKQHFFAFVNAKGSCSMRTFDAETGIFLGKQYRSGNYQDQFSKVIGNAIELTVNSQPNLERDCKQRLPESVLSHLRRELSDLKES